MKPDEIKSHPAFSQPWYYVIELGPGLYTPGKERPNVGLTRRLLHKVEIESGARCLDIGAQEGLVSILLGRRGGEVVAYDRIYPEERIRLVREALGADFELLGEPITGQNERRWLGHGGPMPNVGMSLPELRADSPATDTNHSTSLFSQESCTTSTTRWRRSRWCAASCEQVGLSSSRPRRCSTGA
jgi:hypothetical protein